MFAKLPQRIPFNLLGDEAKLAFRSQPGGISKLTSTRNIPENDSYWNQYPALFDSASDVFTLITPHDVRRVLIEAPENVATLIRFITAHLFNLVSDHTFPTPPNASVASYASSFIKSSAGLQGRNATKEVLNCLRILQRVLPVVFEAEGDASKLEMEVFWKKPVAEDQHEVDETAGPAQFVIEDEDEDDEEREGPSTKAVSSSDAPGSKAAKIKTLPSMVERLFSCLIDLLFCCGFTLPTKLQVNHYKINYTIWEKGVGTTNDTGPNQMYDMNKTEVLRTLLVLFSKQIYASPSALFSSPSLYTVQFVQRTPRRNVLTVLCSLLNTAMNSPHAASHNIIGGVAGKLPYNHLVFKGEDPRAILVGVCFQVLCVLLDFQSGTARDVSSGEGENQSWSPSARTNAFRYFIAKLHRATDFKFILDGVVKILQEQMSSIYNMLPGSKRPVPYIIETVIFLWKMLELNKKFRAYVLDSEHATDLLAYLLCYGLEIKDKPEQHGMCRVVSYIVQSMSAESAFGKRLSSPIKAQLPPKWTVPGSAADFMINSIYNMIATTSGSLNSLYPALIIAISNSAPYLRNLSINSAARLMQLYKAFSNPSFLLSDEGHPRLLFFMLEAFNTLLIHRLSDNPNLAYNIIRARKSFEDLGMFTLARGLREIKRRELAKEEHAHNSPDKGKNKASDSEVEQPGEEKARLLRTESGRLDDLEAQRAAAEAESTSGGPTSPTSDTDPRGGISEKARGKMRAERSLSEDMTGSLERLAATSVGRNGFVPTQEWVTSWQHGLPLDAVMIVTSELYPKIQELQSTLSGSAANTAIIDFLRSAALEHQLPKSLPLNPRRFAWSEASIVWLTSLIWGEIYIKGMTPLGIWNSTSVRLFYVKHTQVQQRQITETVSSVVGGLLGRTDSSQSVRQRQ